MATKSRNSFVVTEKWTVICWTFVFVVSPSWMTPIMVGTVRRTGGVIFSSLTSRLVFPLYLNMEAFSCSN